MRFGPLTTNEQAANQNTNWLELTADDLTGAVANTAQTITLPYVFQVGDFVKRVTWKLKTPFQNTADAAFNTTTVSVGDSVGGVATILAATETNLNGTEILDKTSIPTGTPSTGFTAVTTLTVTFNAMAAKTLISLNVGVLVLEFNFARVATVPNAINSGPILTK